MNVNKDNVLELIKEKVTYSVYPLKMGGQFKPDAFNDLLLAAEEATRLFKNEELVPKKLLSELHLIAIGIDLENDFYKNKDLDFISKKIMRCFNLILAGKSVDDKEPSGPRII
ncbi:hypothetical protein [Cronobacter sakazakii]|uniref:hypothetical protein n=1 Tax=Cronobacter sakazakii TaxID=28141 RepID=UPI0007ABFBF3|nr:hypothetical protein [Cronobacter sakazakii]ELY5873260.1 hypothetical protein [Cronobacter sakazakii]KZE19622.1 hypothetical protein AVZ29_14300 [Cronobacter sakazakii]